MARLSQSGMNAAALAAFPTAPVTKITASDVRNYFELVNKNGQKAIAYGFLIGSNPLNNFTQTFTDSSLDRIEFMENNTWGGKIDVGLGVASTTFDGASEITYDVANNWLQCERKGRYVIDASLHAESGSNSRQMVVDLVKISADGLTETPYLFDMHVNGSPAKTDSLTFPSTKISLEAGERIALYAKMASGEASTVWTFAKCLIAIELYEILD